MKLNKNIINTLVGLFFAALFLFLTLYNKNIDNILDSLKEAELIWLVPSLFILLIVFILRAFRWKILLNNQGYHPKNYHIFHALIMGFFVNSFTPKVGEVIRCTSLNKSQNIPVEKGLGSVVVERMYDVIVLLLGLFSVLIIEHKRLGHLLKGMYSNICEILSKHWLSILFCLLLFAVLIFAVVLLGKKKKWYVNSMKFIKKLFATIKETIHIRNYGIFLVYTFFIWFLLILMNYCFLKALPETDQGSLYFAVVVLFVGGLGWAFPSPGGIGTTHFFILQLFLAFGYNDNAGLSFGFLSNGLSLIYTIAFGLIAILIKFMVNRKMIKLG